MGNYIFSLSPTFTQGLVLGQLSILFLLALILKYLFLQVDCQPSQFYDSAYSIPDVHPSRRESSTTKDASDMKINLNDHRALEMESAEWFNMLLRQVVQTYRSKLRDDISGAEGDEVARVRIESFANRIRPPSFIDPIKIMSIDLGSSAPRLSNARLKSSERCTTEKVEFDMVYTDSISVSLSTSALFNYPLPYFVRLPVTLTVSLSLFSSNVILIPPDPTSENPTLTVSICPDFTLDLKTTSLMGSRAKLADVPKLHELIHAQIRRVLTERCTWKVVLPHVASVQAVRENISKDKDI